MLETRGEIMKQIKTKLCWQNIFANIFASSKANFVSATMFPDVDKQGNVDRKHKVPATVFPVFPRLPRV